MMNPEIQTLKNGVRVVIDPMPSLETVAFGAWARAGSVDERDDEQGVAHLLEHMAFKGTANRSARQIAEEIENVGGYLNAATSHQRTGFYARALKQDIGVAVDLISDILVNPSFDEAELTKEREVVVQEIGEAADTPDDVVFENLMSVAWANDALALPILGTPETVRAQSPDSLRGFMERLYGPEALIIAVSGNVDRDKFLRLVDEKFGNLAARDAPPQRSTPTFASGVRHDNRRIEQTHLALAFPGVATIDHDFYATRLYADILGGGMSSRLFQRIREERGLAYSVYAFADGFDLCGLTGAYVSGDATEIPVAAALIRDEMAALLRDGAQDELDRARALLKSSLMMALESPAARIEAIAGQLYAFGKLITPQDMLAKLEAVTLGDIRRCAERTLSGPCAVSIVGDGSADEIAEIFRAV